MSLILTSATAPPWPAGALAQQKSKHGEAEVQAVQTSRTKVEKSTGQAIIKQPRIDTNQTLPHLRYKAG